MEELLQHMQQVDMPGSRANDPALVSSDDQLLLISSFMVFWKVVELSLYDKLEHNEIVEQIVQALYRRRRQFHFWQNFNGIRWPTDLVSCGQVEATV